MNKKQITVLMQLASDNNPMYETEYDGRVEYYCKYCGTHDSNPHDSDCTVFEAQEALGSIWTDHLAKIVAERQAIIDKEEQSAEVDRLRREKIPCPKCTKKVCRIGMKEHQASPACAKRIEKSTLRANEERTGIKCIVDVWINYDGSRCAYCNKPMPDAHPNKKYCTNKGKGNCKDSHHNRQPHRIQHSRDYMESQREKENQQCLVIHPWFARGDHEGWDEHKDCH